MEHLLKGPRPLYASDTGGNAGGGPQGPKAPTEPQKPAAEKSELAKGADKPQASAQPAAAPQGRGFLGLGRGGRDAAGPKRRVDEFVEATREGGRKFWLPKLDSARRSAVQSRAEAARLEKANDELNAELASLDPAAIMDRVAQGWDQDVAKLDQDIAAFEAKAMEGLRH